MNTARFWLCLAWAAGALLASPVQGASDSGEDSACPCAVPDPVELVLPPEAAPVVAKASKVSPEAVSAGGSPRTAAGPAGPRARVLVLGDSLGLCGFGKVLDTRLRNSADVSAVYSYMACGTIPGSWMRTGTLARAHTACGFWTIEGKSGEKPAEFKDTYGMQKGKRPDSHPVPKLEGLLEEHRPDILIIQLGTNLLSLFSDGKTLLPARHGAQLTAYLSPFMQFLAEKAPTLKRVYWVAPPASGRVTGEIQDFLLKKLEHYECPFLRIIDSRTLIKYPYRNTMPDKEHFVGKDMELWAEGVSSLVSEDIAAGLLKGPPPPRERLAAAAAKQPSAKPQVHGTEERKPLTVRAKLVAISEPLTVEKLLPYQESMVAYLYQIEEVLAGEYSEKEIVVMHPAHIRLKAEPLAGYKIGKTLTFNLLDFEGSPWESIKRSEDTGRMALRPYIRKEDEARFPSLVR